MLEESKYVKGLDLITLERFLKYISFLHMWADSDHWEELSVTTVDIGDSTTGIE